MTPTAGMSASVIEKQEHIDQAARAMKAIAHPLRLKILCVLGNQEVIVQDIVESVGTSQSNISQHLAILRDKGVLCTRKDAIL
jgi:ArsR family transcriptional regulator